MLSWNPEFRPYKPKMWYENIKKKKKHENSEKKMDYWFFFFFFFFNFLIWWMTLIVVCVCLGSRQASYTSHMSRMSYNSHGDLLNGKPANLRGADYRSRAAKSLVPDLVVEYNKHHRRDCVITHFLSFFLSFSLSFSFHYFLFFFFFFFFFFFSSSFFFFAVVVVS